MSRARALGLSSAGVLGLVCALLVARVLYGAHEQWALGAAAYAAGDELSAIAHYRSALGWYVPLSPYGPRALRELEQIARRAERAGKPQLALAAERGLIAGIESARGLYTPHADALAAARGRVRTLVDGSEPSSVAVREPAPASEPSAFFSVLAALGWLAFAASSFGLVLSGADASGRFRNRPGRWLTAMVASAGLFALALWLAG